MSSHNECEGLKRKMSWKSVEIAHSEFKVPSKYELCKLIGSGAYGTVVLGCKGSEKIAVKKLIRPFQDNVTAKRTYRELKLLQSLNNPDSGVIQLIDAFTPDKSIETFESTYLVFPYVPYDLNRVIQSGLIDSEDQIRLIVYSIIRSLKYIHSARIIHRDLKPSNIGLDDDLNTFILDFGLARQTHPEMMTGYVATRWWRAPEILFDSTRYDETADMWSVGCIMAEMVTGKPLFPGSDQLDQLSRIIKFAPLPDIATLSKSYDSNALAHIKTHINAGGHYESLGKMFPKLSADGTDLMMSLLKFDPIERPSAAKALEHPFFADYHMPEDEPVAEVFNDPHEDQILGVDEWKELVFDIVTSCHDF